MWCEEIEERILSLVGIVLAIIIHTFWEIVFRLLKSTVQQTHPP
jgi:hypothetical protein